MSVKKDIAMVKKLNVGYKGICDGAWFLVPGMKEDMLVIVGIDNLTQSLLDTFVVGDIIEYEDNYVLLHNFKFLRNLSHEERIQNFNKRREQYQKALSNER